MAQNFQWKKMTGGVCYYPEHWPKELWADDLDRMKKAGIEVVRVAEFAWSLTEPEEGVFTYDFWDGFLDLCAEKGMGVIFGTPTATPPAWLTEKYPEVLNCSREGVPYRHGARRHYNYTSAKYWELSARIVEKLAAHHGQHPAIVGWQIDNELNCQTAEFYAETDHAAFREFCRAKYGTLDALNKAWGNVFWNQTVTDWSQVYGPRPVPSEGYNPSMRLDWVRFISQVTRDYCKMQSDILRKYIKEGDFITTNGMFAHLDNHEMTDESLDVFTYDSYPNFSFGLNTSPRTNKSLNDRGKVRNLAEVRSVCPHFGIMEQQSGAGGWVGQMEGPAPRPGQLTLWAMQSVAQGADYLSFFRWRTCTVGTEIYWHGILDYDNRDNRKLAEATDFFAKLRTLDPVCGADYGASFAVLKDYDNEWDIDYDAWGRRVAWASEGEIMVASELSHTPYDVVYLREKTTAEDLARYPVVIYPHPIITDDARVDLLREYVSQGGTLVLGCRAGCKDPTGCCIMMPQPGLWQELTGTDVRDFTFTSPNEDTPFAVWDGAELPTPVFNDVITPLPGTRTLATFGSSYYAGEAALTERAYGAGRVLHLGSTFSREMTRAILAYTGIIEPMAAWIAAPETVQLVLREKDGEKFIFVLNYETTAQTVELKVPMTLLYTGETAQGTVTLPPFGTAVYKL